MRARIFAEDTRKWFTLAAVSFGLFMIMLDNTVVNVALPAIQTDLGADLSELQWVVAGYALTFAALMLIGGKLADAYGRRLIFVIGIAVFTAASLWCGLADTSNELIGARVLQGAGAALMNPATLSIIAATFPPRQRGTAIGIWAGVSALALAIGPLVGGLITEHIDWSWIFFVNVPVGIVAIAASFLFIDESRDETHVRLDVPGLTTSGLALFSLTYGLIEANSYGWGSARILGSFALAAVMFAAFILLERHQRNPMLPLDLFRSGTYIGANLVVLLVALAMFGVFFFMSLYMQNILGYSAVQTGAAFLPLTILIILVAPIAGKTSDRFGSRGLMTAGMILIALQLVYFSQLGIDATFWDLLPAFLVGGVGMALDDDAERRRGDAQRPRRQGRSRVGGPERVPPDRRLARDRDHGRDRGCSGRADSARRRRSCTASSAHSSSPRRSLQRAQSSRSRSCVRTSKRRPQAARRTYRARRSRSRERVDRDAPAGGRAQARDHRCRSAGVLDRQLRRCDDRGHRPRGRRVGADPLPALLFEARPLRRLPRRGLAPDPGADRGRDRAPRARRRLAGDRAGHDA